MDVIGEFQQEEHKRGGHIPGESTTEYSMYIMWGEVDVRVHDVPYQMIAWGIEDY